MTLEELELIKTEIIIRCNCHDCSNQRLKALAILNREIKMKTEDFTK